MWHLHFKADKSISAFGFSPRLPCGFFYKFSLSPGVIFPLHCVHHAAILHAGRHHRQRPDLCLSHPRVERLALPDSRSDGTSGVAGKVVTKCMPILQILNSVGAGNVTVPCCDFSSFPLIQSNVFFFQFSFKLLQTDYSMFHILHIKTSDL